MKYQYCLLLIVVFSAAFAVGQTNSPNSPEAQWKEYLKLQPTKHEFIDMLFSIKEPYKSWCAEEILKRDPTNNDLRFLVEIAPQPYAETAWAQFVPNADTEDLIELYIDSETKNEYRERVFKLLSDQNLGKDELTRMIEYANTDGHNEELWSRFMESGPSQEELMRVYKNGRGTNTKNALREMLKGYLTTKQLGDMLSDEVRGDSTGNPEIVGVLAGQLLARPDLEDLDLHLVENYAPEPWSTIAHETRVSTGEFARDRMRRKLCPNCSYHSEKQDLDTRASASNDAETANPE